MRKSMSAIVPLGVPPGLACTVWRTRGFRFQSRYSAPSGEAAGSRRTRHRTQDLSTGGERFISGVIRDLCRSLADHFRRQCLRRRQADRVQSSSTSSSRSKQSRQQGCSEEMQLQSLQASESAQSSRFSQARGKEPSAWVCQSGGWGGLATSRLLNIMFYSHRAYLREIGFQAKKNAVMYVFICMKISYVIFNT